MENNGLDIPGVEYQLMTIKEAAALLASSARHVWRLIAKGELPRPVKVGRSARLVRLEILAYVERLKGQRCQV